MHPLLSWRCPLGTGTILFTNLIATCLMAANPVPASPSGGPAKSPPAPEDFYQHSGFEGREQVLSDAILQTLRTAGPTSGEGLNFTPDQQRMLGAAVARAIKTISVNAPYQHETNDALVKAHLTNLQFAKDQGLLSAMIDHEVKTQSPMILRVGTMLREGGSPALAMIALTERTSCFYQLVQTYQRTDATMRWQSPYGQVLAVTRKLGQHNLTEQEIHEIYTVPLMQKQAELMGIRLSISPWQADGWISMTALPLEKIAAR